MAISKLAKIKAKAEKSRGFSGDGESPFFSLKGGQSAKIHFLQELDSESQYYDDRRGAFEVIEEHSSPQDFKITAECSLESEGKCWACEQTELPDIGKKWRPKLRFYANVLVRGEDGAEDKVKILKRGFSDKDVGSTVINIIEEFGEIGGKDLRIKREGSSMNDTSWSLLPLAPKKLTKAEGELELIPLDKFIKRIPYDDQSAFYSGESNDEGGKSEEWIDS